MLWMGLLVGCGSPEQEVVGGHFSDSGEMDSVLVESGTLQDSNFHRSHLLKNLSDSLYFQTTILHIPLHEYADSCIVHVFVFDKMTSQPVDTISFTSHFIPGDSTYWHVRNRSYQTGWNLKSALFAWDAIIVADFNFDGMDDFAAQIGGGGSLGPIYNFYIQEPKGKWQLAPYLCDSVSFCRLYFEPDNKIFRLRISQGWGSEISSFKYYPTKKTWKKIKVEIPDKDQYDNLYDGRAINAD